MSEPRLEHQTVKVKQLIDDYRSGCIVIPEFQRDYVWKKSKAPLLIDSLYCGFPVSSLLLWQSDAGKPACAEGSPTGTRSPDELAHRWAAASDHVGTDYEW